MKAYSLVEINIILTDLKIICRYIWYTQYHTAY